MIDNNTQKCDNEVIDLLGDIELVHEVNLKPEFTNEIIPPSNKAWNFMNSQMRNKSVYVNKS